jgi:transposase
LLGVDPRSVRVLAQRLEEVAARGKRPAEPVLVIEVRSKIGRHDRCPSCGRRCPGYDHGPWRRWRAPDFGVRRVFVAARPVRVSCPRHGVVTAVVAWARPDARHTRAFEDQAAWCATQMSGTAAARLLRCSWRSIGAMVARVAADLQAASGSDGLDRLRRIGIDEISYRRGHRYLVVVVDHDSRRLVWARPGKRQATLRTFFDALGPDRAGALTHVTCDAAAWITRPVRARAPRAVLCADPFHVVRWAGDAVNAVRRRVWNAVRRTKEHGGGANKPAVGEGKTINIGTWALRKDRSEWTERQAAAMTWIKITHPVLHRAWLLKEMLREVFRNAGIFAVALLDRWLARARRCRIPEMIDAARKITTHRAAIDACLIHGLSNGLIESTNTKIRMIIRRGYGFRNIHHVIALAKLGLGHHQPQLPY